MATPFDNRLLLVHWIARPLRPTRDIFGNIDPRANELGVSIRDFCLWVRRTFPNVHGISVKTLHGAMWQGGGGSDDPQDQRAITSPDRLRDWLRACNEANLELHTWCVPVGRVNGNSIVHLEIAQLTQAMSVQVDGKGIASLSLDVEAGQGFWTGTQADVIDYWNKLRSSLPNHHIALILDFRFRRQGREAFITPWITRSDSLHPMVYPGEFFPSTNPMPVEREVTRAFDELRGFGKPIVPMLQLHDASRPVKRRTTAAEITEQADCSLRQGAAGLTYFRTGTDHFQSDKWPGLRAVRMPVPVIGLPPEIPAQAVVMWPLEAGYAETIYAHNPAGAPVQQMLDIYGKPARYKRTVPDQGATVEYRPQLPARGAYRVQAFIPAGVANASVEYRVMDRPGQPDAEIVTPALDQGRFSDQWITLGDFDFDPDQPDSGKVSLTDIGPDNPRRTVVFGAMRWVRLPR
jgi:hypothetical protein